jgi:hypothetical protein
MDDHDTHCPSLLGLTCCCTLLARARKDERERAAERVNAQPWAVFEHGGALRMMVIREDAMAAANGFLGAEEQEK